MWSLFSLPKNFLPIISYRYHWTPSRHRLSLLLLTYKVNLRDLLSFTFCIQPVLQPGLWRGQITWCILPKLRKQHKENWWITKVIISKRLLCAQTQKDILPTSYTRTKTWNEARGYIVIKQLIPWEGVSACSSQWEAIEFEFSSMAGNLVSGHFRSALGNSSGFASDFQRHKQGMT